MQAINGSKTQRTSSTPPPPHSIDHPLLQRVDNLAVLPTHSATNTTETVKTDISNEMVRAANTRGDTLETARGTANTETLFLYQNKYIHEKEKVGQLHPLFTDEMAWQTHPETARINVFLQGYATGDRYTAILAMLTEPRLDLSLTYQQGNAVHEKNCREAIELGVKLLEANGVPDACKRFSLLCYTGGELQNALYELNEPSCRDHFQYVEGGNTPLSSKENTEHVYHISLTTLLMAEHWGADYSSGDTLQTKSNEIRTFIENAITPDVKAQIDTLVDQHIAELNIPEGSVGIWIANRPNPDARQAQAICNPNMIEQIRYSLEQDGKSCFYIADGFKGISNGKMVDRHPYQTSATPNIGAFWNTSPLFKERENQWYFVDQLLRKLNSPALIGIRSGALEPFALLGHNVIFLEHNHMFTPERHGSWQGRIPYNRLVTQQHVGYDRAKEESWLAKTRTELLEQTLQQKISGQLTNTPSAEQHQANMKIQDAISQQSMTINNGVLLPSELALLLKMVKTKAPAFKLLSSPAE